MDGKQKAVAGINELLNNDEQKTALDEVLDGIFGEIARGLAKNVGYKLVTKVEGVYEGTEGDDGVVLSYSPVVVFPKSSPYDAVGNVQETIIAEAFNRFVKKVATH